MKKRMLKWLKFLLLLYIIVGIAAYFLQEKILFHPIALPAGYKYSFTQPFEEVNIAYDAATSFNIIQFKLPFDSSVYAAEEMGYKVDTACKGVVLYFHGNKENINHYKHFSENFTKNRYEVWMCDYPSFGKSTGKLNEEILYEEAEQVYKLAQQKFADSNIVIYGKSLGTGIASYIASKKNCKRLILETPYYDMVSIANRYAWMYPVSYCAKYKLPTYKYLKEMLAPITIFQGTDDGVVPYSNAIRLKEAMKPNDEFITIEKGIHNNLSYFPLYKQKLDSLLR